MEDGHEGGGVCAEVDGVRVRVRLLSFFLFFGVLWRALVCSGHTCALVLTGYVCALVFLISTSV